VKHRPDIDGLRAVAIVPVVLFHAGIAGIPGGFTGVDVFFVISGYLITGILLEDIARGQFSIARFYERRVRRILPALFAVLVAVSAATVVMMPGDARDFGRSLVATLFFCSNVLFWKQTDYFQGPAESKPLLHTWSLAVEEQFYIFFPLLLYVVARFFKKRYAAVLAVIAVASFALSVYGVHANRTAAFYLLPTRAWELLIGGLLAVRVLRPVRSVAVANALAIVGLGLLAYGFVRVSGVVPFPGVNALFPTVGTALLIYSGTDAETVVGRALSVRPMVYIGLISYSLYLWHWVLIVLAKYYLVRKLSPVEIASVISVAFLFAGLSWRFVENPFRGRGALIASRRRLFAIAAAAGVALASVGALLYLRGGFPSRFDSQTLAALAAKKDIWKRRDECRDRICTIGAHDHGPSFLLWGDSHAGAIAPAFEALADTNGISGAVAFAPACAPLLGLERYDEDRVERCVRFNQTVLEYIQRNHITTVFLHARWALYAEGSRYKNEEGFPLLLTPSRDPADDRGRFDELLGATVRRLRELDVNVVLISSVPEVGFDVPMALARNLASGRHIAMAPTLDELHERQAQTTALLAKQHVRTVDPSSVLCDSSTCAVSRDGNALYSDTNHLSVHGAMALTSLLAPLLSKTALKVEL